MAKNKVKIDVKVDDKGTTKKVGLDAKKASEGLDDLAKSGRTVDRNLKGTSQQSANSTKNFSKMAQGITGGLVPAYAILASNVFALSAAFNFFRRASDVKNLEESQVSYAQNTGIALQAMTGRLREASGGMLGFREAAQAAAIGVAKGFSSKQLEDLAEGARKASTALGRDFQDSFDRLVRGASKAEPELLDELGITLRLETATKNYAAAIGKQADALTAAERSQAVLVETQRQLNEQFGNVDGAVNPFIRLSKTFEDLLKTVTQALLPVFEGLANLIADNGKVALAFFGLLGLSILKSIVPIEEAKTKFKDFRAAQAESISAAKAEIDSYKEKIKETTQTLEESKKAAAETFQGAAGKAIKQGATSPVLQRAAKNQLKGPDISNLKKALASAEKQYAKHGKITRGIFKGISIDIARQMTSSFRVMEAKAETTGQKIKRVFSSGRMQVKLFAKQVKAAGVGAFAALGKAAGAAGKAMNAAMKATVILGTIQLVYDLVMSIAKAPYTIVEGFYKAITFLAKGIQELLNYISEKGAKFINWFNKTLGRDTESVEFEPFTFGTEYEKSVQNFLDTNATIQGLKTWQTQQDQVTAYKESLESLKSTASSTGKELANIISGLPKDNEVKAGVQSATAISTLGISGLIQEAISGRNKTDDQKSEMLKAIEDSIPSLGELSPALLEAVRTGNVQAAQNLEAIAGGYVANLNSLKDGISNIATQVSSGDLLGAEFFIKNLKNTGESAEEQAKKLGISTDALERYNKAFESAGGSDALLQRLQQIRADLTATAKETTKLNIESQDLQFLTPGMREQAEERINLQKALNALEIKNIELRRLQQELLLTTGEAEKEKVQQNIDAKLREIDEQNKAVAVARRNASELSELGLNIGTTLESTFSSAIQGLIDGTTTLKDSFANMAKSILKDIAAMITKMIVFKALTAAFGSSTGLFPSVGSFLGIEGRRGGMFEPVPGYAAGGIARGRDAGYPAILHGTEAVVPLPNGNAIPVEFNKEMGSSQMNNVTVNVTTDGRTSSQSSSQQGENLGQVIAAAVQKELQNQKRSGGILNPYGSA